MLSLGPITSPNRIHFSRSFEHNRRTVSWEPPEQSVRHATPDPPSSTKRANISQLQLAQGHANYWSLEHSEDKEEYKAVELRDLLDDDPSISSLGLLVPTKCPATNSFPGSISPTPPPKSAPPIGTNDAPIHAGGSIINGKPESLPRQLSRHLFPLKSDPNSKKLLKNAIYDAFDDLGSLTRRMRSRAKYF
jgi:hypothetical protein